MDGGKGRHIFCCVKSVYFFVCGYKHFLVRYKYLKSLEKNVNEISFKKAYVYAL